MKLFIPTIGTRLRLTEPWNFALFFERRNKTMFKLAPKEMQDKWKSKDWWWGPMPGTALVTAPKDTILTVDRVYIRSGARGFDSITFKIAKGDSPDERFHKTRFWVKLEDCNNMECEIVHQVGFAGQDEKYENVPRCPIGG